MLRGIRKNRKYSKELKIDKKIEQIDKKTEDNAIFKVDIVKKL